MAEREMWYDREGRPIDMLMYAVLRGDPEYFRVAEDLVGHFSVSTVWLGLDHNYMGQGPPLIFETMVFGTDPRLPWWEEWQQRYATREGAEKGHKEVCDDIARELQIALDLDG